MLPIETKLSNPTEISSLQNTTLLDENQPQICLLPSNLNKHTSSKHDRQRNANQHIPSALIHEYITPVQSEWNIHNKTLPFGYYLQFDQYENKTNGSRYQVPPFSVPLNSPFTSVGSTVSTPTINGDSRIPATAKRQSPEFNPSLGKRSRPTYSAQETEYENLIQPCFTTNQQHILTPSFSLSTPSLSSTKTSIVPPTTIKRKYNRRARRPSVERQLLQYPNSTADSIFSNYYPPLPLPCMANTLARPNECSFPVDLIRDTNFAPLSLPELPISSNSPSTIINSKANSITVQQRSTTNALERHQISEQYLSDQRCNHVQKTINNYFTSNLSYKLPYFLGAPREHYYMFPPNPISINIPTETCSTLLPGFNTTFSPLSCSNNMKKEKRRRDDLQNSEPVQSPPVEVQTAEKSVIPIPLTTEIPVLRRRLQKKSKLDDNRVKSLIKRMKQRNKLAVLKFMIRKRKQQQIAKKKLAEIKTETIIPQMVDSNISKTMEIETKLSNIIASSLKITFNADQKLESISLYYHQRHKPEIQTKHSLITSNNKLGLLIEAVNFIEMDNDSPMLTIESIE